MCEYAGVEAAVDDPYREARPFYLTFGLVTLVGAVTVLIPGVPLLTILVATQVLNAVLLVPLLFAMIGLGRDRDLMGDFTIGRAGTVAYGLTTAVVVACVAALAVTSVTGELSGQARPGPEAAAGGASGREKVNTAPPAGWLATVTVPPWERAVCSTIDRPRPEPGFERASGER